MGSILENLTLLLLNIEALPKGLCCAAQHTTLPGLVGRRRAARRQRSARARDPGLLGRVE